MARIEASSARLLKKWRHHLILPNLGETTKQPSLRLVGQFIPLFIGVISTMQQVGST